MYNLKVLATFAKGYKNILKLQKFYLGHMQEMGGMFYNLFLAKSFSTYFLLLRRHICFHRPPLYNKSSFFY